MAYTEGAGNIAPKRSRIMNDIKGRLKKLLDSYGYTEIFLPVYDYYDILSKTAYDFKDENIIRFIDRNTGKSMVLRPDFTPQVCRYASNYLSGHPMPLRISYNGRVFRNVNMDKGVKSENYQVGCELFGSSEFEGDTELVLIAWRGIQALELKDCRIVIGDSQITNKALSFLDQEQQNIYKKLLEEKNIHTINKFAEEIDDPHASKLLKFLPKAFGGFETLEELSKLCAFDAELAERCSYFAKLFKRAYDLEIPVDLLVFDGAQAEGLSYYTGMTIDILHSDVGYSIGSGGRYDNLVKKFGYDITACGIAFYLEEIVRLEVVADDKIEFDYLVIGQNNFDKAEQLRKDGYKVFYVESAIDKDKFSAYYSIKNIII